MTKDEALKLALKALEIGLTLIEDFGSTEQLNAQHKAITAIYEALAQPEPNYKKALEVWLDKTEWVQETVKPHELGMHRADVLKQRIEAALAQPEQEPVVCDCDSPSWCKQYKKCNRKMLGFMPYVAQPQRTWVGLTDKDWNRSKHNYDFQKGVDWAESILKEKNT